MFKKAGTDDLRKQWILVYREARVLLVFGQAVTQIKSCCRQHASAGSPVA